MTDRSAISTTPMPSDDELDAVITKFSAQLGEIAWHSVNVDHDFDTASVAHTEFVKAMISQVGPVASARPLRFLEVAPYLHTTAQSLNQSHGMDATACDISPHSLRLGAAHYQRTMGAGMATLVASDFHDLPFSDGFFDITFIASAVHHTWRPETVIGELIRVTRAGGLIILYNEPVGSRGCFYRFRTSRAGEYTAWEQKLVDAGLLRILSSPFPGSRDEELFGMVENDRIALSVYQPPGVDIINRTLTPHPASLDEHFAQKKLSATEISATLNSKLAPLRESLGRKEALMGFDLPTASDVDDFSATYAEQTKQLSAAKGDARLEQSASLYGATMQVVYRKHGTAPASSNKWRREGLVDDGVVVSRPVVGRVHVALTETQMPAIEVRDAIALAQHFPTSDWLLLDQGSLYAQCLLGRRGRISLPTPHQARQVLLLRYFAVANDTGPYWVDLYAGEVCIASHAICKNESRLLKLPLPADCRELEIRLREDGDVPMTFHLAIRVPYLNTVACRYAGDETR
jgi:ubiquinone/menaquinone biosynthesis C-methylase UbiE